MPVRLIAIDIDGTLLDGGGRLPEVNRHAVRDAIAGGIEVALVTGRSFHHTQQLTNQMPASIVLMLNNGALVKASNGTTLTRHALPRAVAQRVTEGSRPFRDGVAAIFDRSDHRQFVCEGIDWTHPQRRTYYARNQQVIMNVGDLVSELVEDPIQIGFTGSVMAMRVLANRLSALPRAEDCACTLTEYEPRDFSLLDVIADGCSKGRTLAEWADHRGITRDEVMAVGDNLNDREMLEFAGVPVVMGNSVPALKSFGWPETGSNDAGGLADAITAFALRRR